MDIYRLPRPVIQTVGLACLPGDIDADAPYARRPVAVAVLTLVQRDDGHVDCTDVRVTDARALEFPIAWCVNEALMPGALTVISAADRETLGAEAMARRFFLEPRLARIVRGDDVVDPVAMTLPHTTARGAGPGDEADLCRRLSIPVMAASDAEVTRLWSRHAPGPVEEIALAHAVSRLMLWTHAASLTTGEAGPLFETMIALRGWMDGQAESAPVIHRWATSRPVMRAVSFVHDWRLHCRALHDGDTDAGWTGFEDGLFHS